ncbi:MAG: NAD(P)-dependent oxidoreductase [Planctomycetes bacterium]|nr:NAD(P)-dependent oxidoreductase [Planctomycetota bacterium]
MRVLVTGASGFLGHNFCRLHASRFELVTAWGRRPPVVPGAASHQVDLADGAALGRLLEAARPDAILHLGAMTRVEECERNPRAWAVNHEASRRIALFAAARGLRLVHVSTDLVFDGTSAPYREEDRPAPVSDYGRTKAAAEEAVLAAGGNAVVCRISLAFGRAPDGALRQIDWILRDAAAGKPVKLFTDEWRTPIDAATAADCLAELIELDLRGILHVAGTERWSRFDFGRFLLARAGLDPGLAVPGTIRESPLPRPPDVSLDTVRARRVLATPFLGVEAGLARVLSGAVE